MVPQFPQTQKIQDLFQQRNVVWRYVLLTEFPLQSKNTAWKKMDDLLCTWNDIFEEVFHRLNIQQ